MSRTWDIKASVVSSRTSNPIRKIVDQLNEKDINPSKPKIDLSIGDPTIHKNFPVHDHINDSVIKVIQKGSHNGYANSAGFADARAAVAKKYSCGHQISERDVYLTSGCSGALEIAIMGLANEGENILIPSPGFSLYQTLCDSKGVARKCYNLLPNKDWECDVDHMRSLIDDNTRAILVNNPSNPCGSVYSRDHLQLILNLAEEFCLPIISDEIYANMVFSGYEFVSMASLTDRVPIIVAGGLAKQYLVPGWRVGWLILYDKAGHLTQIRDALTRLTTLIVGANTLIQGALPAILHETPEPFYQKVNDTLQQHAEYCVQRASKIPGLHIVKPRGAMYLMVGIDMKHFNEATGIIDDITFSQMLMREESVIVLPSQCFRIPNFFRIVFCAPVERLEEAFNRIEMFCARHGKSN